jgi:hypothetical protein
MGAERGWETKADMGEDNIPPDLLQEVADEICCFDPHGQRAETVAVRIIRAVAARIVDVYGP